MADRLSISADLPEETGWRRSRGEPPLVDVFRTVRVSDKASRMRTNARTTYTLISIARALFSTLAAMIAPCSENTRGRYLRCRPCFKITFCDLKDRTKSHSAGVRTNEKSSGKRGPFRLTC